MRVVSATVMLVIVLATASGSQALAEVPSNVLAPALRGGDGAQDLVPRDWLQASSLLQAGAGAGAEVDPCQVCTYVLENKGVNQPYLCRGLKDPASQKMCVNTLLSMFWWMDNVVYWVNYGCQRVQDGKPQWVKPCPADAMCSWIKQIAADENGSTEFCPERSEYIKPQ